jgi:hypothetical protein
MKLPEPAGEGLLMDRQANPGRGRKHFVAALLLFFLWVVVLGVMAVATGHKPVARSAAPEGR